MRLGALSPSKQVDFLLDAVLRMVGFLDRVNQVTEAPPDLVEVRAADDAGEVPRVVEGEVSVAR